MKDTKTQTARKPGLLVVTRNLPPMIGGMERLVWHIIDELRQQYMVCLVGPEGCGQHLPDDVRAKEVPVRPLWLFFLRTFFATLAQARHYRPGIILAGSGLTAPFVWLTARLFRSRCIVFLHGFDAKAKHPVYRCLWMPLFRRFDQVIVNSAFTKQLALDIGVDPQRITTVHPGVTLPDMALAETRARAFRKCYQLTDAPMMLYVGRITARKGLLFFVEHVLPSLVHDLPDVKLVVIGDNPADSAQDHGDECGKVRVSLARNNLLAKVLFLGNCRDDELLSGAYFAADTLIFPLRQSSHDVEGFGMVALEAAAHGLPTVAFAVGGVVDAVQDDVSGRLVSPGDAKSFTDAVLYFLRHRRNLARAAACRNFAEPFCWLEFGNKLRGIVEVDKKDT